VVSLLTGSDVTGLEAVVGGVEAAPGASLLTAVGSDALGVVSDRHVRSDISVDVSLSGAGVGSLDEDDAGFSLGSSSGVRGSDI